MIVGVGDGELCACGEAGAERKEKERYGEDERFDRRTRENRNVKLGARGKTAPINRNRKVVHCGI